MCAKVRGHIQQQTALSSAGEMKVFLFHVNQPVRICTCSKVRHKHYKKAQPLLGLLRKLLLVLLYCDAKSTTTTAVVSIIIFCDLYRPCNVGIPAPPHKRYVVQSLGETPKTIHFQLLAFASVVAGEPRPRSRRIRQHNILRFV